MPVGEGIILSTVLKTEKLFRGKKGPFSFVRSSDWDLSSFPPERRIAYRAFHSLGEDSRNLSVGRTWFKRGLFFGKVDESDHSPFSPPICSLRYLHFGVCVGQFNPPLSLSYGNRVYDGSLRWAFVSCEAMMTGLFYRSTPEGIENLVVLLFPVCSV